MTLLCSLLDSQSRASNIYRCADRWTDGRYQVHYLSASLKLHGRRSIMIILGNIVFNIRVVIEGAFGIKRVFLSFLCLSVINNGPDCDS